MSVLTRAAVGGALLALAAAPAAEAAKKKPASFSVTGLKVSDASLAPGQTFKISGKVKNAKKRKAASGRVVYSLRKTRNAKSGSRLSKEGFERTKGSKSRSFSERVVLGSKVANGTYYVTVCANRSGASKKVKCSRKKVTVAAPPGPPAPPAPPAPDTRPADVRLREAISSGGMKGHLQALQDIASRNGGNRASGFQGYGASVEYIVGQLRAGGYNPTVQVFDFVTFEELSDPTLIAAGKTYGEDEFSTMDYSAAGETGTHDITPVDVDIATNVPDGNDGGSGCQPEDFDDAGFADGDIALIQRGDCDFAVKAGNAQQAGASGVIVFNQGNDPGRVDVVAGTLGETAQDGDPDPIDIEIPVVGTSYAEGQRIINAGASTGSIIVDAESNRRQSSNVLADTPGGNPDNVIIVGSHLDSVPEGPGINDNGSGSAFNLELAIQMAKLGIQPANRVRFAFWGAEESGLVGATRYVEAIDEPSFNQIAANLNFDMLASPNHARLVYDGDFSDSTPPTTAPDVNPGAVKIEKYFNEYLTSVGANPEPTGFDGRSDYKPFQDFGVPAGGLFSGAEVAKSAEQAAKWGGTAGQAFDPNYHEAGDDINNLDLGGYEILGDAAAHVTALLATDAGVRQTLAAGRKAPRASRSAAAVAKRSNYLGEKLAG